jgi:hypothetical protein
MASFIIWAPCRENASAALIFLADFFKSLGHYSSSPPACLLGRCTKRDTKALLADSLIHCSCYGAFLLAGPRLKVGVLPLSRRSIKAYRPEFLRFVYLSSPFLFNLLAGIRKTHQKKRVSLIFKKRVRPRRTAQCVRRQ